MKTTLDPDRVTRVLDRLAPANLWATHHGPHLHGRSQPVHTVYGGAHLFRADTPHRLGQRALAALEANAPEPPILARVLELPGDPAAHETVYVRTRDKLEREPVEDYRIDFEDGYGLRPDDEEDASAGASALELARAMRDGTAPARVGIRIKALTEESKRRAARTLDGFVSTLLDATDGVLPAGFVVTLPKVDAPEQVGALVELLEALEAARGLPDGALPLELMIETPRSLVDERGRAALPALLEAARGRCVGAHLGSYDLTASVGVSAPHQALIHPVNDHAKHWMQLATAPTGLPLSDGATTVMPVGPHAGPSLSPAQEEENRAAVHAAWRVSARAIRHSLAGGFHQGWDLHPGQLPVRFAVVYADYLVALPQMTARLARFVEQATRATRVGAAFDDAATGQGLLGFFLRGLSCGAITPAEAARTGLTPDELATRSFARILDGRRSP